MSNANPQVVLTNAGQVINNVETIKADISLMLQYATESGKELPSNLSLSGDLAESDLIQNYNAISKVVAPANVQSIRFIQAQMLKAGGRLRWYQIPIFTKCIIIASISLVFLIGISLSPTVNEANLASGLLESSGRILFFNLVFVCAASLLGVMFYLLKTYATKIKNYTLLPSDAIELNASIIIGVISGFVIAELFAFTLSDLGNIEIHKMTLALLGGFSSDAIFSLLQSVVNKLKGLIGN